jgi:hypothetical protein
MDTVTLIRMIAGVFGIAFFVAYLIAWRRIFKRAGFPALMWLLMLIPLVNLIGLCYLAFAQWRVKSEDLA